MRQEGLQAGSGASRKCVEFEVKSPTNLNEDKVVKMWISRPNQILAKKFLQDAIHSRKLLKRTSIKKNHSRNVKRNVRKMKWSDGKKSKKGRDELSQRARKD